MSLFFGNIRKKKKDFWFNLSLTPGFNYCYNNSISTEISRKYTSVKKKIDFEKRRNNRFSSVK